MCTVLYVGCGVVRSNIGSDDDDGVVFVKLGVEGIKGRGGGGKYRGYLWGEGIY